MLKTWIYADAAQLPMVLLSGVVVYAAIVLYVRITGLRSFSKMTAADFAMTVAVGSLFGATIATPKPNLLFGLTALAVLFAGQWGFAFARRRFRFVSRVTDNPPLLLMAGRKILDENLREANLTRADLFGKLREANALSYDAVRAVIFESTGDVSVLHGEGDVEPDFLAGVRGADRLLTGRDPADVAP